MSAVHFNYVRKEAALHGGKAKSRLHLYQFAGEPGKDPFAIAAKKIEGSRMPKLNCIQKMFNVVIAVENGGKREWYIVNINSAKKRLQLTRSEIKTLSPEARGLLFGEKVMKLIVINNKPSTSTTSAPSTTTPTPATTTTASSPTTQPQGNATPSNNDVQATRELVPKTPTTKMGIESVKGQLPEKEWNTLVKQITTLYYTPNELDRELKMLEASLATSPDKGIFYCRMSRYALQLGLKDEAKKYLQNVTEGGVLNYLAGVKKEATKIQSLADSLTGAEHQVAKAVLSSAARKWTRLHEELSKLAPAASNS
jgi:hypothetical protein